MTIDDILNSDLSNDQKIDMIEILRKGGKTQTKEKEEKQDSESIEYKEPIDAEKDYVVLTAYGSPSNFVSRLKDANRKSIDLGNGMIATHKLAWVNDDNNDYPYIIYPEVQEIDGNLVDLSLDSKKALESALSNNDYIRVRTPEQANWFTKNYKQYFPGFDESNQEFITHFSPFSYKEGGSIKEMNPTEIITIGDQEYNVEIADTEEKRKDGLSRCKSLKADEGMLFIFDEPTTSSFTMEETDIDLDIIFIDSEGEVLEVHSVEARDPNPVVCESEYQYVLEVNIDSEIQEGDELDIEDNEFSDEEKEQIKQSKMLVLNSDGDVQMKLVGGERIVSMIKTRQLIKAALKAYRSDNDSDYRRVGKLIFTELDAQDSRDPQYVEK